MSDCRFTIRSWTFDDDLTTGGRFVEIGKRDVWSVDEALLFDKDVTKKILDQVMTCNLQKEFRKRKLNKYHTRLRNRHTTFDGLRTGVPAHR